MDDMDVVDKFKGYNGHNGYKRNNGYNGRRASAINLRNRYSGKNMVYVRKRSTMRWSFFYVCIEKIKMGIRCLAKG